MTSLLPPNLLKLFAPRPPVPYLKPLVKDDAKRGPNKMTGVGPLITRLRTEADEEEIQQGMRDEAAAANGEQSEGTKMEKTDPVEAEAKAQQEKDKESATTQPPPRAAGSKKKDPIKEAGIVGQEAVKMRREARRKRQEEYKKTSEANYKPQEDPEAIGDPYKTLFISRLSKKTTELDLRREFEMYGAIERIRIVQDRKGKSRSFAFIVYERERDMKAAYKDAEGIPIHHKRILVDVERGRTVKGWKPQKLGGGLGGRPKPVEKTEMAPPPAFGGGGGFRGGFRGGPPRGGGGGFRGGPPGGGGFRGGGPPGGGGFRGGGFGGRGGFGGGGGGPPGGGGGFQGAGAGDRGYGDRGGFGGGAPRGGGFGGGGYGGGPPGGYGGGGGGPPQSNGYQSGPPGGGYGGGGGAGGYKRDFDGGAGGGGGYGGGGYGGGGPPPSGGGYDDRDPKRMRY